MKDWATIWQAAAALAAIAALGVGVVNSVLSLRLRNSVLEMRQDILDRVEARYVPREQCEVQRQSLEQLIQIAPAKHRA